MNLDPAGLLARYRSRELTPAAVVESVFDSIRTPRPVWISLASREKALERAAALHDLSLPLYGLPFAVKDNIDVAGFETTAGCPQYAYRPARSATAVERLEAAGAICIGKTNLDQFATGLVGVRSPYGACASVFNPRYISGGSSSGSAVAVASGQVSFALGTDTAGSGRVPAAFNELVGVKPTRGVVSTAGVVPACRTLDCVTTFTRRASDARLLLDVMRGFDPRDPFSRVPHPGQGSAPWLRSRFRFGLPRESQLQFFGDGEAAKLFFDAVEDLRALGGEPVPIDYQPFREAADLLYSGPWVAERLAAIGPFLDAQPEAVHPVVRQIIEGGRRYSSVDTFQAIYRLESLRAAARRQWERMDLLLLPTTGTIYTIAEVEANPIEWNTRLGAYTNFVNLLDLAAVAVPAGRRPNGLPFGVSFIGPAFSEDALLELAGRWRKEPGPRAVPAAGCILVAVVGAHLSGEPLNGQLTSRGARLVETCRTAPEYRLFALANTAPAKPGLVRELGFAGPGIEIEIWSVPEDQFGGFVAEVPPPLGIGNVLTERGETVKCFLCEPYALAGATEITSYGGWRAWRNSRKSPEQ